MHSSLKYVVLFFSLSLNLYAAEIERIDSLPGPQVGTSQQMFVLPEDINEWRNATTTFMAPVLTSEGIQQAWEKLLDLTMPKTGIIDPSAQISKARRAQTIQMSFNTLLSYTEEQRISYLEGLLGRHHRYVNPNNY